MIIELLDFVEVFVERFEDSERDSVHGLVKTHIGAIHKPISILFIEL